MSIIARIVLKGMDKEIKRMVCLDNDITMYDFCIGLLLAFNAKRHHVCFFMFQDKEYATTFVDDRSMDAIMMGQRRLKYLIKAHDKATVEYVEYKEWSKWTFQVWFRKITDEKPSQKFSIISGKGRGIFENSGGVESLERYIYKTRMGQADEWCEYLDRINGESYDVDDFNITEVNQILEKRFRSKGGRKKKVTPTE